MLSPSANPYSSFLRYIYDPKRGHLISCPVRVWSTPDHTADGTLINKSFDFVSDRQPDQELKFWYRTKEDDLAGAVGSQVHAGFGKSREATSVDNEDEVVFDEENAEIFVSPQVILEKHPQFLAALGPRVRNSLLIYAQSYISEEAKSKVRGANEEAKKHRTEINRLKTELQKLSDKLSQNVLTSNPADTLVIISLKNDIITLNNDVHKARNDHKKATDALERANNKIEDNKKKHTAEFEAAKTTIQNLEDTIKSMEVTTESLRLQISHLKNPMLTVSGPTRSGRVRSVSVPVTAIGAFILS